MDAKKLEFDAGSFDIVLDKGTLDSILVHTPSCEPFSIVRRLLFRQRRADAWLHLQGPNSHRHLYVRLLRTAAEPRVLLQKRNPASNAHSAVASLELGAEV